MNQTITCTNVAREHLERTAGFFQYILEERGEVILEIDKSVASSSAVNQTCINPRDF